MKKNIILIFFVCTTSMMVAQQKLKVGNNPTTLNPSAVLEVESANKGVLIPRIGLLSTTDATTINAPATSLLVYNTATLGTAPNNVTPGFYYWNGTLWVRIAQDNSILYDGTKAYTTSDIVEKDKKLYRPNSYIPEDTEFLIGTTGSTWYEISNIETAKFLAGVVGDANKLTKLGSDGQTIIKTDITEDASGNVGVGTANPGAKLEIEGTGFSFLANNSGGNRALRLGTSDGEPSIQASLSNGSPRQLSLNPGGGNVGIGTISPSTKLHIAGTGSQEIRTTANTSGDVRIGFDLSGAYYNWIENYRASGAMVFATENTERMRIDAKGNVGIGVTPSAWSAGNSALQIGNSSHVAGSSALTTGSNYYFDAGNKYYGTGAATQYYQTAGSHVWQTALSGTAGDPITFNQTMTLDASGNLGIGTTAPTGKLHVQTDTNKSAIFTNATHNTLTGLGTAINFSRANDGAILSSLMSWNNGGLALTGREGVVFATGGDVLNDATIERMRIDASGNVGIGTVTPVVPLHIATGVGLNSPSIKFFNSSSTALQGGSLASESTSIFAAFNIVTAAKIVSAGSVTASDKRIKNIIGISDNQNDLSLLNKIKVTNYTHKDYLKQGNQVVKKVIAQEVEKVLPAAVLKREGFIPNIYALSTKLDFISNDEATISVAKLNAEDKDIKVGVKLKIFNDKDEEQNVVIKAINGNDITVSGIDKNKLTDKAFVYGVEVNDFRTVDYDAIAMLNVSATQQLSKEVDALKADNTKLKNELKVLQAQMKAVLKKIK